MVISVLMLENYLKILLFFLVGCQAATVNKRRLTEESPPVTVSKCLHPLPATVFSSWEPEIWPGGQVFVR